MYSAPDLPPDFDFNRYRSNSPDLASCTDEDLVTHYRRFGQYEGRSALVEMERTSFVDDIVKKEEGVLLEIGPYNSPALRGPQVRYLDVFDATELRRRAALAGLAAEDCPETIDYTCPLDMVEEKFSAIFSSHCIEHQPDLVQHLIDVGNRLLVNGRYYIVIPDNRYCFDALQRASTIGAVLQAHRDKRTRHTYENIVNYFAERTHNDAAAHWNNKPAYRDEPDPIMAIAEASRYFDSAGDDYVDTHAWQFTPDSFWRIATALRSLGLSRLVPSRVYGTPIGSLEFCCVLENRG